jgi:hypothetical protein
MSGSDPASPASRDVMAGGDPAAPRSRDVPLHATPRQSGRPRKLHR